MLFKHIGNFHFNVFVFDHSSCEKEFTVEEEEKEEEVCHFVITMTHYHARPSARVVSSLS